MFVIRCGPVPRRSVQVYPDAKSHLGPVNLRANPGPDCSPNNHGTDTRAELEPNNIRAHSDPNLRAHHLRAHQLRAHGKPDGRPDGQSYIRPHGL